jgi:hypothetical protein
MNTYIERYIRSTKSSNLKDSPHDTNVEPLISIAWSGVRMGSVLYRVKYGNDAHSYTELLTAFTEKLTQKSKNPHKHWPQHIRPAAVAKIALDYWLNPICYICKGRGEDVKINQHGGIDRECHGCGSTGKRPPKADKRVYEYVLDAISLLHEIETESMRTRHH